MNKVCKDFSFSLLFYLGLLIDNIYNLLIIGLYGSVRPTANSHQNRIHRWTDAGACHGINKAVNDYTNRLNAYRKAGSRHFD